MTLEREENTPTKRIKLEPGADLELSGKISKQVDYYFSDVNVVQDKFLLGEFKKDDGWVKLSVLLTFSRLKEMTTDVDRLVKALKEVEPTQVEFDDVKLQVRRKDPVPDIEEYKKELDSRTVHVSGFPTDVQFETLQKWCLQYGEVESVQMRRHFKTRYFKGCIHVTFKHQDDAKKILDADSLKFKDRDLRKESMEEYRRRKREMAEKRMEHRKGNRKGGQHNEEKPKDKVKTTAEVKTEKVEAEPAEVKA